ncbi:YbaB/EbfC family DNA-binding protein [Micromonospora sp. WMMD987]|uniref:YbaB/EbfC family DNA-binding protein n=1 Tax=Micromonospora sp. WMMD987 TaxID=3016089 RepID=UPI00249A1666|nr:YbaB/EbfC family DNA-binding protein [Micromonospora sp. WMMD987]WFE92750.1 YbaB/EbfC family DNA-binding protein [Micromonospora sp. WMMD987]
MWADEAALDATARRLDEWEASFTDRAERARQLAAQVQALTGTARSPDRTVEVTVDPTGLLVDLRLDEQTRQHSATHTARQIMATSRAARADLLRRITEATTRSLGPDDPTARAIIESHRQRLHPGQGTPDAGR